MEHSRARAKRFLHRHHSETGKRLVPLKVSFGVSELGAAPRARGGDPRDQGSNAR